MATIRSTPLAASLATARSATWSVSAANPTRTWPGRRRRPELGQDVGRRLEDQLGHAVGLVQLGSGDHLGTEVGHRRGHDHHVGRVGPWRSTARSMSAAVSTRSTATPASTGWALVVTSTTSAPRRAGGVGHGVALLSRRSVGDEPHRVDRFTGAAGRHHHPDAGEVAARAPSITARPRSCPGIEHGGDDHRRLGQPAGSDVPAGQPPVLGRRPP